VTAEFVERTINNKSWVLLTSGGDGENALAFPSPVDLCESDDIGDDSDLKEQCYEAARRVASFPLRCFALSATSSPMSIRSVGASAYENDHQRNTVKCTEALAAL